MAERFPSDCVFYAEDVWEALQAMAPALPPSMLDMQRELAKVADAVIVVAESDGALHELGAFSWDQSIVRKLLAVVDTSTRGASSFLELGPLARIDNQSLLAPAVAADLRNENVVAEAVCSRLEECELDVSDREWCDDGLTSKQYLLLLCDVLFAVGRASLSQSEVCLRDIADGPSPHFSTMVALGIAFQRIALSRDAKGGVVCISGPRYGPIHCARAGRPLPLMAARAASLGILMKLDREQSERAGDSSLGPGETEPPC